MRACQTFLNVHAMPPRGAASSVVSSARRSRRCRGDGSRVVCSSMRTEFDGHPGSGAEIADRCFRPHSGSKRFARSAAASSCISRLARSKSSKSTLTRGTFTLLCRETACRWLSTAFERTNSSRSADHGVCIKPAGRLARRSAPTASSAATAGGPTSSPSGSVTHRWRSRCSAMDTGTQATSAAASRAFAPVTTL